MTDEVKEKISYTMSKMERTPCKEETKLKISNANKGKESHIKGKK